MGDQPVNRSQPNLVFHRPRKRVESRLGPSGQDLTRQCEHSGMHGQLQEPLIGIQQRDNKFISCYTGRALWCRQHAFGQVRCDVCWYRIRKNHKTLTRQRLAGRGKIIRGTTRKTLITGYWLIHTLY